MELNKYIDYTNLKAYAKEEDIKKLCDEAIEYGFASVFKCIISLRSKSAIGCITPGSKVAIFLPEKQHPPGIFLREGRVVADNCLNC